MSVLRIGKAPCECQCYESEIRCSKSTVLAWVQEESTGMKTMHITSTKYPQSWSCTEDPVLLTDHKQGKWNFWLAPLIAEYVPMMKKQANEEKTAIMGPLSSLWPLVLDRAQFPPPIQSTPAYPPAICVVQ